MSDLDDRIAWIRLAQTDGIGPLRFGERLKYHGTVHKALEGLSKAPTRDTIYALIQECSQNNITILIPQDPLYPESLRPLPDRPPVLFTLGNTTLLSGPSLAIVGSRRSSLHAQHWAQTLSKELSYYGWTIISGMARGIDACAHRGALDTRQTVAVLAGGIDQIYPPEHRNLYDEICQKGCIVSEDPPGTEPKSFLFPKRNRLIAALSEGVVVVEAAQGSGSLITAKYALDMNRDIFAVPGPPWDPRCHGSNHLLRQGAFLCEGIDDILSVIKPPITPQTSPESTLQLPHEKELLSKVSSMILEHLSPTPIPLSALVSLVGGDIQSILEALTELEIHHKIMRDPIGNINLRP